MTKLLVDEETKSKLRTNPFTDRDWLARRRPAVILVCNDKDVVADTFHKPGPSSLVSGELPMNFGCEILSASRMTLSAVEFHKAYS